MKLNTLLIPITAITGLISALAYLIGVIKRPSKSHRERSGGGE